MTARPEDADDVLARRLSATDEARLIQALAARRARTATARAHALRETRNG